MAEKERMVTFELLGQEFKFYTAASDEELQSILSLVRQLLDTGPSQKTATLPVGRVAIMACLNIASRYVKLEQEYAGYRRDSEERLLRLNENIRAKLLVE